MAILSEKNKATQNMLEAAAHNGTIIVSQDLSGINDTAVFTVRDSQGNTINWPPAQANITEEEHQALVKENTNLKIELQQAQNRMRYLEEIISWD